jgi:hypothetical protein
MNEKRPQNLRIYFASYIRPFITAFWQSVIYIYHMVIDGGDAWINVEIESFMYFLYYRKRIFLIIHYVWQEYLITFNESI